MISIRLWLSTLLLLPTLYTASPLKLVYFNDFAPYSWEKNGKLQGILIDIMKEALQERLHTPITQTGYPWARAQMQVQAQKADGFVTVPTKERLTYTTAGDEAVISLKIKLFTYPSHPDIQKLSRIQHPRELQNYKIGDYIGNGWAKETFKGQDVLWFPNQDQVFGMLSHQRIDALASDQYTAARYIRELHIQHNIIELPVTFHQSDFHLCIQKDSPYTKIIPQFDQTIRQMKQEGTWQKILDRYL